MIPSRVPTSLFILLLAFCWGCAQVPPVGPPTSTPFFQPASEDRAQLATLASELDAIALECAAEGVCEDRIHFARALLSLFENREAARASFEQVLSLYPSSSFAASSALWLQLLKRDSVRVPSEDPQQPILMDLTAQSVRHWLASQWIGPRSQAKTGGLPKVGNVQALSRQVQERERHIAELRAQLDALKLIDQDQQDRHRKMRVPASLLPNGEIRQYQGE
jgi:hypothetical protein